MAVWIGTSGWQYASWRGGFYPQKLAQRSWLEHYVDSFEVVEVNNTFYHLPEPETFDQWRQRTAEGFRFGLKLSRYLSHIKRLKDPEEAITRFMERANRLGSRLGPLLLQLPPKFIAQPERLRRTLSLIPGPVQVAVELRDRSWFTDQVGDILMGRAAPLVLTDRGETMLEPEWVTANWGYVRLHHGLDQPWSCYTDSRLGWWAERVAALYGPDLEVFVFFNNDPHGCAVRDAVRFEAHCHRVGLRPTRVPALDAAQLTDSAR